MLFLIFLITWCDPPFYWFRCSSCLMEKVWSHLEAISQPLRTEWLWFLALINRLLWLQPRRSQQRGEICQLRCNQREANNNEKCVCCVTTKEKPTTRRNMLAMPKDSVMLKKDSLIMRLAHQLETATIPPPRPLYLNRYISEFRTQGTVPIPGAYAMIYNPNNTITRIPILLGQPWESHTHLPALHTPLTLFSIAKHALGRNWIAKHNFVQSIPCTMFNLIYKNS